MNSSNGHNGHKVLRSATVGYIAPPFEGKEAQINEGEYYPHYTKDAITDKLL